MKIYHRLVLLLLILISSLRLGATHLMGGEITWECQGNGRYVFTLKLYRDCNGIPVGLPVSLRVHNHPTVSTIALNLVSKTDISPKCNGSGPTISCETASGHDDGAVEEFIFRSNAISLPGTPPPQGWVFTFDECCRNEAISNLVISPDASGLTLRAIMYPYQGRDAMPCFDSSPVFAQAPAIIICSGSPFTYNHNAYDPDKDSLVYSFGQPLDWLNQGNWSASNPAPLPFYPAYSVDSPFPGPGQNGSIPASLNKFTGEIAFIPRYLGNFVTVVCVKSYRCGILISEVYREIQVVVLQCGVNSAPQITAPFINTLTGQRTEFIDTVYAGDPVDFSISVSDPEYLPIGLPQSIKILASGGQFGNDFSDPGSGCANPPCATLSPPPPVQVNNNGSIQFHWQTTCNHVAVENNCFVPSSTHTFVLVFQDDYCPAPAYRIATITIVVVAQPVIPPPSLRCTEVLPNGDVKLSWLAPPDPENRFNSYHLYSSSNRNGPFVLVDSIFDINTLSFTHTNAGADTGPRYYYLKSRSGCDGQVFSYSSDTLSTMFLNVQDGGSGLINLTWNALRQPMLPSTQLPYQLYKQIETEPYLFLANSQHPVYEDFMKGCLQQLNYYIRIPDQSGCYSQSNRNGGLFSNDEPPKMGEIDSVSIRYTDNLVWLSWPASPSTDTRAYIVYRYEANQVVTTDTVFGNNFNITGLNPQQNPLHFRVSAIDSCNNISQPSQQHSTIHLNYTLSACEGKVDLHWTAYEGWMPTQYQIFENQDNQGYVLVGNTSGNTTSYTLNNLNADKEYCFIVRAIAPGGQKSSTSHAICFDADVQTLPNFNYNRKATVLPDGKTFTLCFFDNTSDLAYYRIERSLYPDNHFEVISEMTVPSGIDEISYTDQAVNTDAQSYQYRFVLIDKCGNEAFISNNGRTILLKGEAMDGFINRLRWNSYGDWDAGVEQYQVYRSSGAGQNFSLITVSKSDTTYQDMLTGVSDSIFRFCYYVEAIEKTGNQYGFRDTSISNVICLNQKTTIYIPNSFRPGSNNDNKYFKAKGLYEKQAIKHEFVIYNRWGEMIFSTDNPLEPWDGTYKSKIVPSGVYVYRLRFRLPDGSKFDRKGAVLVLD